ncbi:hypothetical protein VY88_32810 [Azospirillum thiophilum]|uniref:DUF1843 domain-containing protein n=1 Tax=Azospirillum thiophilum TaxID=528244 RepID=A0AAC8VZW7_9PROT|nr:DUF1843 domain-containing protein [Azospirillum thiophilum]ALG72498.1 hypothetical protein AL072_15525 [Azospirillum thiophilum]KJR61459.1 hypothetical protein VY88_32810 [Azospirillum thiophilum]
MSELARFPHYPMYMATITDAIAKGDLAQMKTLQSQAEEVLTAYGDIPTALQLLKVEIAKAEAAAG